MSRTRSGGPALAVVMLALVTILAACAAGGGDAALGDQFAGASGAAGEPDEGRGAVGSRSGEGGEDDGGGEAPLPYAAPIEQRIVKTGEMTLEVGSVGEAIGRVRAMALELGGYVGGSQAGTLDDRATLTLRIPAATFEDALSRLNEMEAEVLAVSTREEDVTSQVVDLAARIDNLEASEASYRELVARAERVEDILAVQSRLDQVRGEIEQLQAQLDSVEGRAALSTLTVTLVPKPTPVETTAEGWNPGAQLDRALASLVGIGQGLLDGLIWFAVVWLPVLLVLSLLVLVALRGVLEVRRRLPTTPVARQIPGDEGTA